MTTELFFAFATFALIASITPGPNNLMLMASGTNFGLVRSIPHALGVSIGFTAMVLLVGLGLAQVFAAFPVAHDVLKVLCAAYLIHLAWKIATAPPLSEAGPERPAPSLTDGLLLSLVNPKGYAAMLALFASHTLIAASLANDVALKIAITMVIILFVNVVWLNVGAGLARFFRSARASRIINITFAVLLLASAALLIPH